MTWLNILLLLTFSSSFAFSETIPANYTLKWFEQKVDHMSFVSNATFAQRYIISTEYFKPNGPIFFYTGNEGDIFAFANNTGFLWEAAPQFGAMVVFMEHRYYGESLPFGNESYNGLSKLGYLTVEQALADYAFFLVNLKDTTPDAKQSPVVVFGGSYGGMLSAWFRMRYPHIAIGALAASAPLLQFPEIHNCSRFSQIVTQDYEFYSPKCSYAVRRSANYIIKGWIRNQTWLAEKFHLCKPLEDVGKLFDVIEDSLVWMAMLDYSNPSDFLVKPPHKFPAHPVMKACEFLTPVNPKNNNSVLNGIYNAISIFTNVTGEEKCLDLNKTGVTALDTKAWDFQECAELLLPMCNNEVTDMFVPNKWNLTKKIENCKKKYGIVAEPRRMLTQFGGEDISAASNIIFSNGLRDPWSGGSVLKSISSTLIAINIPGAAHHEDLRFAGENDSKDIIDARKQEIEIIKGWIEQYNQKWNISSTS